MALVALVGLGALPALAQTWVSQGPGPTSGGQVSGMDAQNSPVYGAIERIAVNPTNSNTMLIGTVNGGVWRTTDALDANPNWTPVTDFLPSLSIGGLTYDTANPNIVYAGIGQYSAYSGIGGASAGLFQSTNGGLGWAVVAGNSAFTSGGSSICAVIANGQNILVTSDKATNNSWSSFGLWRSTDGGLSFSQVTSSLLPDMYGAALAADPTNTNRYYVAGYNPFDATKGGVWRTDDAGASWTNIDNAAITAVVGTNTVNMKLSVNTNGTLFVGIVNSGQLAGVFRTQNQGASFTDLGLPTTVDGVNTNGLITNKQGNIHFSMLADPGNDNVLYVGGATQWTLQNNSTGATNWTGRLFRSDGTNWTAITDNFTSGGSAPHADSRALAFDSNGNLIEGDDGGLFRQSSPTNSNGNWTAIGGSGTNGLRVTEIHSLAYDSHGGVLIAGAQDTGAMQQNVHNSTTWTELNQGDGGVVGVYDRPGTNSYRYNSYDHLSGFTYSEYNNSGTLLHTESPALQVDYNGGGHTNLTSSFDPNLPFYAPFAVNAVDAGRLVFGTKTLYESSNHAANLTALGGASSSGPTGVFSSVVGALAYGGFKGTNGYADVLYVGAGNELWIRAASAGFNILPTKDTAYNTAAGSGGFSISSIVLAYTDWKHGFVAGNDNRVFCTTDGGVTWTEISGLSALIGGGLDTLAYIENGSVEAVFAGGLNGVFWSLSTNGTFGAWSEFGSNSLPNAVVTSLYYDRYADVLAVGTLGRGAWTIENASQFVVPEPGTVSLLLAGCCTLIFARRRQQNRHKR